MPPNLTHLKTGRNFFQKLHQLPTTLQSYSCYLFNLIEVSILPKNIKNLEFVSCINYYSDVGPFPPNLTHLTLGVNFTGNIENLPINLKILKLGQNFNKPLPTTFPTNLTHLYISESFNQTIHNNNFPPNLTHLFFGYSFNQDICDFLPATLKTLVFGTCFNKSIKDIPHSITHLTLGARYCCISVAH